MGLVKDIAFAKLLGGGGGGPNAWMGAGAEFVKSLTPVTKKLSETGYATWTPSTTSSQILGPQSLGSVECDFSKYEYFFLTKFVFKAVRKETAVETGAYILTGVQARLFVLAEAYTNSSAVYLDKPTSFGQFEVGTGQSFLDYYATSGARTGVLSASYGVYTGTPNFAAASGTYPNETISANTNLFSARCNTSYFSTASAAELDQDKSTITYTCDVFRVKAPAIGSGLSRQMRELWAENSPPRT